ncbi:putative selenium-dependent hydroxylase accessory protein YqeC [Halogeometricum borinquense]|uniref:Putative selenium-dependent hydroxylase accessory protein YqeC n=1 Tax=Halogeometricum borinquense TaxID=60847 RepID=A0A482TKV6_9EURY|nr:selenium cofactor biosynthesis protein YqeC [Halogeometricum borinquense]RYJ14593.1 putative selenium-dependent hydroxylase accessory protein YqeC [Halogeometricum borinquense]
MTPSLPDALGLNDASVLAVVGAGGKKTLLYRLASVLSDAIVTATVRIPIFDSHVESVVVTDDPVSAAADTGTRPLGLVPERERPDRYRGYDPAVVDELAAAGETPLLVKADGARNRLFKAPGENEPQIPDAATVVSPIAAARVVGESLTEEAVHRPERVAELTDCAPGETIRPEHVASVVADASGGLKGVPQASSVIPVVNMADTSELEAVGREIATGVLDRAPSVSRVLVTRLNRDESVVEVVERD